MNRECICAMCKKVFISEWTEEEAKAEYEENFKGYDLADPVLVCDDCYRAITINGKPINFN